jgi:uroporphyrin-III C-methyltransferase
MTTLPGVALVGAGPGDPELLTVRALRRLSNADVVVHDRLVHPAVLELCGPHVERLDVGKAGGDSRSASQADINALLIARAKEGKRVVRLKGGDPFVFGRGGEEAMALSAAGIPWEVVPGLTAGVAATALSHIPVTHRGLARSVAFVTGTVGDNDDLDAMRAVAGADTIVIYMAGRRLHRVTEALHAAGVEGDIPAAVVVAGSWEHERVVVGTVGTIGALWEEGAQSIDVVRAPALLIVGRVVALRAEFEALARVAGAGLTQLAPPTALHLEGTT